MQKLLRPRLVQFLSVIFVALVAFKASAAESSKTVRTADLSVILQGRAVYLKNCVFCHGPNGDGRGEMGLTVRPRPRNFRAAVFKFRSTPSGSLPTDDDLMRTIRTGLTGTAMPSFSALRDRDARLVIEYVKSFSSRWDRAENYSSPVGIPAQPSWFSEPDQLAKRAVRGKRAFAIACAPCHGVKGDGHGTSAAELKDSFEEPIVPSDLSKPLRCGSEAKDIYRVLATGIDGTPMPTFLGSLTEEQLWEIIAYVLELKSNEGGPAK